jgi:ATP-dependent exoDNAse (exonuclease V) alpha subunit
VDAKENRLTVERELGTLQTYDPRRLSGVSVHRESEREFSQGDRVQFTAPSRELHVANRDLGTVEQVNSNGDLRIRMDSGQEVRFNVREHPHLDYGYAIEVEQELAAPKADPVGQRGARPSEEEQGHSLGIGLA